MATKKKKTAAKNRRKVQISSRKRKTRTLDEIIAGTSKPSKSFKEGVAIVGTLAGPGKIVSAAKKINDLRKILSKVKSVAKKSELATKIRKVADSVKNTKSGTVLNKANQLKRKTAQGRNIAKK